MLTSKQRIGNLAEDMACQYLLKQKMTLIQRNYRCRQGEIDLIMLDAAQLVFVEVRSRRSTKFGSGAETVDARKQRKLIATASHYLQKYDARSKQSSRFDVISINTSASDAQILWIKDAFQT